MAETLLSFGVEKLWDLLVRETDRFKGVDVQLNALKSDLNLLRSFLKDADAKKHTNALVRNCVEEIKEIVYDAEDVIQTFVLKEELGKTGGVKKCLRRLSCIVVDRREVASDMEGISKRISKVIGDMQNFGVQQMIVDGSGYAETLQERQREMRHTFPNENESHLVGLEQNVKKLVGYLVEKESTQVVSVIGMGGIGKTTLARQVFNHETIKKHFDGVVWVCVSQQFTRKDVWQTILLKLSSKHEEHVVSNMTEDELQEKLFRMLETRKCLIVLDDMWKEEDWDRIKLVFPPTKGWKVLLTSRIVGVALHANPKCIILKPEYLNREESWTLLQRIAFPVIGTTEYNIYEMEEMGKQMLKQCGGLPLAIKVLGGLLAAQFTLREWKRLHDSVGSHIVGGTSFNERNFSSVYHILYLSFEELPIYLKQCFLYLAHFPEDWEIDVGDMSYYWAAEGIPRPRYYNGSTIRDVGDGYIEELVKRNMIIAERDDKISGFQSCRLHDMMREVCLQKAKMENFVEIVDASSTMTPTANAQLPCKSRRLIIQSVGHTFPIDNPKLRSLLLLKRSNLKASELRFTSLQMMRVLDLSHATFKKGEVPSSIGKLIHLKYLSFYQSYVTKIPFSMGNLKQLLYLNLLVGSSYPLYMPNILKEMRELTYLHLPERLHKKVKMELGNLLNLETLENFSTEHGNVRDLQGMTRLIDLSIRIRDKGCNMKTLSSSLSELRHLENLNIEDFSIYFKKDDKGFVLDCVHLRQLKLEIYMPKLPDVHHFPSRLIYLELRECRLKEDPMPILEKLLHLKEVTLWKNSFYGRRMVCSRGGFLQLQKLKFRGLKKWEEWIVEEGSMPLLHTLVLQYCKKLKELPDGLTFITSLKTILLKNCLLEEDPMPILGKLLHLREVNFGYKAFSGKRMVCSRGGFPQLQKFVFSDLNEWEEWIVEEDSMPLLQTLEISICKKLEQWIVEEGSMPLLHNLLIRSCENLKEIPDGLRFITSLKDLIFDDMHMGVEWEERLSEGGEDYYKVQHIPSVRFFY